MTPAARVRARLEAAATEAVVRLMVRTTRGHRRTAAAARADARAVHPTSRSAPSLAVAAAWPVVDEDPAAARAWLLDRYAAQVAQEACR